ncbi:helicase HerA domain-containing protein [Vibrio viridaestus]|uniref:DUF87 domain-containing protein n=1 Tax=Vibrio viridaestus TaxID=2487322 RepID=A0A3N9TA63_9VIBR|nr:DUF87 domain-containing protein [Vibrio viridaestus]RQW61027.1 DUF87 domain-containing protein [Vibrio viridaestus]
MSKVDTTLRCEHKYVIGASGSGKSYHVKELIKALRRVLIWDADDEYGEVPNVIKVQTPSELMALIESEQDAIIRYVPNSLTPKLVEKQFDFVSLAAFVWGNCAYVAEEIADVTTPAKAVGGWGKVLRRGRKRGVTVFPVTQRPAEADKTVFTQVAKIRAGRLDGEGDIARVANNMRVPKEMLSQLGELEYIELDRRTGQLIAGKKQRYVTLRKDWNSPLTMTFKA